MSLYDLLVIMPLGSALGGGLAAAEMAGKSKTLAIIGLASAVGVVCVAIVRTVGERVIEKYYEPSEGQQLSKSQESALRLLYLGAAACVVISGFIGYQLVAIAIRITS